MLRAIFSLNSALPKCCEVPGNIIDASVFNIQFRVTYDHGYSFAQNYLVQWLYHIADTLLTCSFKTCACVSNQVAMYNIPFPCQSSYCHWTNNNTSCYVHSQLNKSWTNQFHVKLRQILPRAIMDLFIYFCWSLGHSHSLSPLLQIKDLLYCALFAFLRPLLIILFWPQNYETLFQILI
jgi:hypothetical protein